MKFLLVDDSKLMRTIEKKILKPLGAVEFAEAGDGLEALRILEADRGNFDLVLIDWNMPYMDGLTLVDRIRASDKHTPLIMVTTEAEKEHVLEAIKAGVNNYAIKPFTHASLLRKVRQTLAGAA